MKRLFDITGAVAGMVIFAIPALLAAAAVRISMGGPVLFRQQRQGLHRKPFIILKFRSMMEERDACGVLLPDEERMTRLGHFLRRTSLDEVPQFWNVLKGDMSLVGPRPLTSGKVSDGPRFSVRPGITGLAQVTCRRDISASVSLDEAYASNHTIAGDLSILFKTVAVVWRGENTGAIPKARANFSKAARPPEQQSQELRKPHLF